ncbi:MAG: methyltransferase [Oceanospirillaceae bacterium]|nr:methyltransferase [Oceanospirillaceae bacterium]
MTFPEYQVPDKAGIQRLFHGRGHTWEGWEHVQIDWYPPVVMVVVFADFDIGWAEQLAENLQQRIPACESVLVQRRGAGPAENFWMLGPQREDFVAEENGLKYQIRLGTNQNTGFFPDMANGRAWVRQHALGRKVLNLFSYTCSFSVVAIAGGAERVLNMDMSKRSLSTGRENHRLNDFQSPQVLYEAMDIFRSFGRIKRHGPFDLLVCDPPSFQKGSVDIKRDYRKILRRLPEFMAPGAELLLCLNDPALGQDFLKEEVAAWCPDAQFVERIANPEVLREASPDSGLKVLRYRYLPQE